MVNREHLDILKQGFATWNQWRQKHPGTYADLHGADLTGVSLFNTNLSNVNLAGANLTGVSLSNANLSHSDLSNANLSDTYLPWCNLSNAFLQNANLSRSNLTGVNLAGADLSGATLLNSNLAGANLAGTNLSQTNISHVNLAGVNLSNAQLRETNMHNCKIWNTLFAQVDLTSIKGLETIEYRGPSYVDLKSVQLPNEARVAFLRGVGYFEAVINDYASLFSNSKYYPCFISHSNYDNALVQRLYRDLQNADIRCWFTLHDLQPDPFILQGINRAAQSRERIVLVLSENTIKSPWIEQEVRSALYQETQLGQNILFPICLDNAILQSQLPWAVQLRQHYIGDFTRWQNEITYAEAFATLLYHLKGEHL